MTEDGFRERGWEAAVMEAHCNDHINGWDAHFVGGLQTYLARLAPVQ